MRLKLQVTDLPASRPLSIADLAGLMGIDTEAGRRRLRRYLLRVETRRGVEILRAGADSRQGRYTTTIAALRKHCPELIDERGEIATAQAKMRDAVTDYTQAMHDRVQRLEDRVEDLCEALTMALNRRS